MTVPTYGGVQDFVSAVMGGGPTETAAYDARMQRLINQRSSTALMEKRIQDVIKAKAEADAMVALPDLINDPLVVALTQSGTGSSYSGAQTGEHQRMENEMLANVLPILQRSAETGQEVPWDYINALIGGSSGKLLGPTNVNVMPQALADEDAQNAMAGYRRALESLTGQRTATEEEKTRTQQAATQTEQARAVTQQNLGNKYVFDAGVSEARIPLIEAQTKYTNERHRGGPSGSGSGRDPLDNAALVNALLGTYNPELGMYDVDQDFFGWRHQQALIDPRYWDDIFAYGAYKAKGGPINATPQAQAEEPVAAITTPEADVDVSGIDVSGISTPEDAQVLITEAEAQIAAARAAGNEAEAARINATLLALLAKAGFSYDNLQGTSSGAPQSGSP